jgi:hypothetical protein
MGQCLPHVPPRLRLLSNAPLPVDDEFWLVVVSPHQTAAIISLFVCGLIQLPKRRAAVLPTHSDPALPLLQCTL